MRPAMLVIIVAVLISSMLASLPSGLRARAAVSLRVSPALVELEADPGAKGDQPITLENSGDETTSVTAAIETYKQAEDKWSAVDWLEAEPGSFTLEPGETRQIDVKIDVPDGLESGGRYTMVTFTTGGDQVEGNGASVAGKLGVAFLVTVDGKGKLERDVEIDRFAPVLEPDGRIGFRALLKNQGIVHAVPAGVVSILNADDKPFASLEFPAATALLPADQTLLAAEGSLPKKSSAEYHAEAAVNYGAKNAVKLVVSFKPTANLVIDTLRVCENLDRGPSIKLGLQNNGQLGLMPPVLLEVLSADSSTLEQPNAIDPAIVWPGERAERSVDLAERLASGDYTIHIRVDYAMPDQDGRTVLPPIEQDFSFSIGGLGRESASLCSA